MKKIYDIPKTQMRGNESLRRVYDDSESPTLDSMRGGNREPKIAVKLVGGFGEKTSNGGTQFFYQRRVCSTNGAATALAADFQTNYKEDDMEKKLTIRKLTEGECYRLMGFEREDEIACKEAGQSAANIYHQAGDSIVSTVLCGIFGELLGIEWKPIVEGYCDKLHEETK